MTRLPPPAISPCVSGSRSRPLFSVMVPVYNRVIHLPQTLESVLQQDPGAGRMQIEVVDDASTENDPEGVVKRVGGSRVSYTRNPRNLGLVGNFNACIELARGQWVHLLHSDDYALPGLYAEAERLINSAPVDAIGFRCRIVDEEGGFIEDTPDLSGLASQQALREYFKLRAGAPLQFAGVFVRRDVYEQVGGFRPELPYCTDMDMWSRVFSRFRGIFSPAALACFRAHEGSAGAGFVRSGEHIREYFRLLPYLAETWGFSPEEQADYRRYWHDRAHSRAMKLARQGDWAAMAAIHRASWDVAESFDERLRLGARAGKNLLRYLRARCRRTNRLPAAAGSSPAGLS